MKTFLLSLIALLFTIFYSAQSQNREELVDEEGVHQKELLPETVLKQSIIRLQQNLSHKDEFAIRMKMADAYLKIKTPNFAKSTEMLFKAKEIAENANDTHLKAKIYGSIANQYSFLNFTEKIKPYLDLSKKEVTQLPDGFEKNFLIARLFIEYGNLDADQSQFDSAKKNYQNALKSLRKNGSPTKKDVFQYRRAFYNIGVSYLHLKQNDSAEYFLNKALKIQDSENKEFKYFIYNTLGKVYANKNEHQRAVDSLEIALAEKNFKDDRLKADVYKQLIASYKNLNLPEKYIEYSEKLLALDPNVKENNLKAIHTAVNEEQKSFLGIISVKNNYNKLLLLSCLAIIILGGICILFINNKRKQERLKYQNFILNLEKKPSIEVSPSEIKTTEKSSPNIPTIAENMILEKLEKFEASTKFTNPKLSVASLAVLFKTNPTYLSETIKKHKEKNFNNYINELRINYICKEILEKKEFLNFKISYLAEHAGFSSHSTFTTVFKMLTGISPSTFLREAEKKHNT